MPAKPSSAKLYKQSSLASSIAIPLRCPPPASPSRHHPAQPAGLGSQVAGWVEEGKSETLLNLESEIARVKSEIEQLLPKLGKHKIEALQKVILRYFEKRFKGKLKTPKYGHLNKGFSEQQLQAFFRAIDNDKYKLLFGFMAYVGLRIGEAVRVNVKDINLQTRELVVKSEKTGVRDVCIIPIGLFTQLLEFMDSNKERIEAAEGSIFFKEQGKSQAADSYLDSNYARNKFRKYIVRAELNEVYDESEESISSRKKRKLHILTTHSLRHYAITKFYNQTKNWLLTSKFARHIEPNTTTTYIHTDRLELYSEVDKTFKILE